MSREDPMDRVDDLLERNFEVADGQLVIGGVAVDELAATYGTPFFVYDRALVDAQLDALRSALPVSFDLFYSIKANPNAAILGHFLAGGCGLEVASAGEFEQAIAAGCPAERIIFAGPGKTVEELELVVSAGIGEIHAESATEIDRLGEICERLDRTAHVALRVNPGEDVAGGAMRMGGTPSPFGIDEETMEAVLSRLLATESLVFAGIHLFAGTQILDHEVLAAQYRRGLEIGRRASALAGEPLAMIDFGGGLGIPYFPGEERLDTAKLRVSLDALFGDVAGEPAFAGTRFVVEPGRFLIGEAGVYVSRVNDIKVSRDKKFLIADGGMHHHLAASGNLGMVIKRNFPTAIATKLDVADRDTVDVVGPLCTPLDTLGRSVSLPTAAIGDLVAIFQAGAYARAASPLGFLSHRSPPEVWVDRGSHLLIRERGEPADYLRDQPAV